MAPTQAEHMQDIVAVLTLLSKRRRDPGESRNTARAMLVLEDAMVALHLGLRVGLPIERITEMVPLALQDQERQDV